LVPSLRYVRPSQNEARVADLSRGERRLDDRLRDENLVERIAAQQRQPADKSTAFEPTAS
jgi:hypothetical protein